VRFILALKRARRSRHTFSDFMHDTFPHRRSWNVHDGWVFRFGPFRIRTNE
jgi:hypothetical protein